MGVREKQKGRGRQEKERRVRRGEMKEFEERKDDRETGRRERAAVREGRRRREGEEGSRIHSLSGQISGHRT